MAPADTVVRPASQHWEMVDEGWGRAAVDFATLSEPGNVREYVAMHQQLGVAAGDRLLDLACGAGLALELAAARGATGAGIDASPRLIAVAGDRNPGQDVRVGDMHALPWADASFDVVTSFRGIWGTTPDALTEAYRVLAPGGRLGITVWGHIKRSEGAWALAPFRLASQAKVANQAAMVALGRPGAGEQLLAEHGFVDVERIEIPFVWEFADPAAYARALISTGPAYEAIQTVGEQAFREAAEALAAERVREGLPLRAPLAVVGYVARKPPATPAATASPFGFLAVPETTESIQHHYDRDVDALGYVMNVSRVWAHMPDAQTALFELLGTTVKTAGLSFRQRGILVTACAAALGDSYCSLAWGDKLSSVSDGELAAGVLRGDDVGLDPTERALAVWARRVAGNPNATAADDLDDLRAAGYDDTQIFAITTFIALRIAFSTVNDALGAAPDHQLGEIAEAVVAAVGYGRPIAKCV